MRELNSVQMFSVPRHIMPLDYIQETQIHGFADASEKAYGAVCYLMQLTSNGTRVSTLICAKSRVAPIKTYLSPHHASSLLVKLVTKVKSILNIKLEGSMFWTDSTIVLSWLNSEPSRWSTFVANRTAMIQTLSSPTDWRHVPSRLNPADLASRGVYRQDLQDCSLWCEGPEFLKYDETSWPLLKSVTPCNNAMNEEKTKQITSHVQISTTNSNIEFWKN